MRNGLATREFLGLMVIVVISSFRSPCADAQTIVATGSNTSPRTVRRIPAVDRELAKQHSLWPTLELAVKSYQHIRKDIRDYSCMVVRRERVNGVLQDYEYMQAKIRHRRTRGGKVVIPFSVYLKFLAPMHVNGREVLYVAGRNGGDMFARHGGKRFSFVTTRIRPDSDLAMHGNRYPVTEFGFENLIKRLIEVAKEEIMLGTDCEVEFFHQAKVDGRNCTGVRVSHPTYDSRLRFYSTSVFVDNEMNVPIHYEAHDWPDQKDGQPVLLEQYTYRNIRLNVGFTNADFEPTNPNYRLR